MERLKDCVIKIFFGRHFSLTNIDRNIKQNKIIKGIKASGENAIDSHSVFFIQQNNHNKYQNTKGCDYIQLIN